MVVRGRRTVWDGRTYDSQLEATWGATLATLGARPQHHPGRLRHPELDTSWEPDFLCGNVVLEVKGAHDERIEKTRGWGLPVVIGRAPVQDGARRWLWWHDADDPDASWFLTANGEWTRDVTRARYVSYRDSTWRAEVRRGSTARGMSWLAPRGLYSR